MWNMVGRIDQGIGRTNNIVERWHRGIQASLDGDHPSLGKFTRFLQTEEVWTKTSSGELQVAMNRMVDQASRSAHPPRRIISQTLAGLGEESQGRAQKRKAMATRI